VPLLHGHAGRGALHARPRQCAARRHQRPPARRGAGGAADVRGLRPLSGMQGLQGRVPVERGHGQAEVRVPGQYYAQNGTPLRARLFARIEALNRLGCACVPLSNWSPALRLRTGSSSGSSASTGTGSCLLRRETFPRWFAKRTGNAEASAAAGGGTRGQVVLFHDTYTTYNYPELGKAAVKVLEAAGFEVILADKKCCGRPDDLKGFAPAGQGERGVQR